MRLSNEELIELIRKAIYEHGPMSVSEITNCVGNVTRTRVGKIVNAYDTVFEPVGNFLISGQAPQPLWGIVGFKQELVPETPKLHPFDLPKHSIIYRDLMKQQRVKYERY